MNTKTKTRLNWLASLRLVFHPAVSFAAFPPNTLAEDEAPAGWKLLFDVRQLAAACYNLYAPAKDMVKPQGQWNHTHIRADGAHVEHWLNGKKVVEYERWSDDSKQRVAKSKHKDRPQFHTFKKGSIARQEQTDRLEVQSIKIRVLPARAQK